MDKRVEIYKSKNFDNDLNLLTVAESNFSFKQTRSLVEMLKAENNVSHLSPIDNPCFNKPLYAMKTTKDLRVLLILEENISSADYTLILLRIVPLQNIDEAVSKLEINEKCSPFEFVFNEFW